MLTKKEVQERLCALAAEVMDRRFKFSCAADCFCGRVPPVDPGDYRFDEEVMSFIEGAVRSQLKDAE